MKLGMIGLGRMGADIPARAIHPEAGVDVLVEPMLLPAGVSEPAAVLVPQRSG
jgi:3-hydroxyisobutyrate dehydrogenase-like beta-hydroxyacid dehydrogenase